MALQEFLILRRPRSGRLEGRRIVIQRPFSDLFTASNAGIHRHAPVNMDAGVRQHDNECLPRSIIKTISQDQTKAPD